MPLAVERDAGALVFARMGEEFVFATLVPPLRGRVRCLRDVPTGALITHERSEVASLNHPIWYLRDCILVPERRRHDTTG